WPVDRQLRDAFAGTQTNEQLLRVLREESRTGLHDSGLAKSIGLDGDAGADCVAVAGGATQAHGERRGCRLEIVSEDPKLRRLPIGHHGEVRIGAAVEVEDTARSDSRVSAPCAA